MDTAIKLATDVFLGFVLFDYAWIRLDLAGMLKPRFSRLATIKKAVSED